MTERSRAFSRLEAKRQEQTPQALARLVVAGLFIGLWTLLWLAHIPMPVPFLLVLLVEVLFFLIYWRTVFLLPSVRSVELAHYGMLTAEIVFHTTIVYFLGGISWLGALAYVFGLIFTNTFLDLRRGLLYTGGASLAFTSLILLEATGVIPHYVYLEQGPLRYTDARFVATTIIGGFGVFFSIYLWTNWVGHQLRHERDAAIRAQDDLLQARAALQRANEELEERVRARTAELELANRALRESEERLRAVVCNAPIVLFAVDREGIFTLSEGKGLEGLGLQPGEVVGQSVFDLYADVPAILDNVRRALAGEAVTVTVEAGGLAFETHYTPVYGAEGDVTGVIGVATDVTERKRTEHALRESQEWWRSVVENAPSFIIVVDRDGVIQSINHTAEGITEEETVGSSIHDWVLPEYREMQQAQLERVFQTGEPVDYEIQGVGPNGTISWYATRIGPIRDNGNIVLAIVMASDITERKHAEEALRESEAKYRRIFENVQDIFFQTELTGTIIELSPSVEQYGYTREQLIGTSVLDIYANAEEREEFVRTLLEHGEVVDYELRLKAGDGRVVNASASARIRRDADGAPIGIEGALRDITERKRAEEALRESEAKFRTMAETVAAATFIFQGTELRYVNPAAEAVTGYSSGELLAMNFWDVIHPDLRELVKERGLARQRGEQVPPRYEVKLLTKDGEERWVDFTAGMVDFEGKPAILGTAFDITERKRAEEALREQARRDALTGVLNHAAIVEELGSVLDTDDAGTTRAVAMVDVNDLKIINDTYGHQTGDAVLLTVAEALARDNAIVGRYGGDEFVVILPGADRPAAERYRDTVLAELAHADLKDPETGASVPVVASIGLAISPDEADTIADLIGLADSAMYASRRQRSAGTSGLTVIAPLGADQVTEMVSQILPLLASPAKLEEKIRLIAQRISAGGGYDAVNIDIFSKRTDPPDPHNAFAWVLEELLESWHADQRPVDEDPFIQLLRRTRRGIIVDDPQHDERLTETQRQVLQAANLRAAALVPLLWEDKMIGMLSVASTRRGAFTPHDLQFLTTVATQVTAIVRMASLVDELQSTSSHLAEARTETVLLLAAAAEAHDQTTGLHLQSVRALSEELARELGYEDEDAYELGLAAVLHDIGKIRVPDAVLTRSGKLSDEAWELMKQHTIWGAEFLAGRPGFELASAIARSHHERWDGTGYPDGLSGEAIPEAATIVAVADSFDAMTSDRPYGKRRSMSQAVREITTCSGKQFSPKVVDALLRLRKRKALPRTSARSSSRAA